MHRLKKTVCSTMMIKFSTSPLLFAAVLLVGSCQGDQAAQDNGGGGFLQDGKGMFSYNPVADNGPFFWPTLDTGEDENQCSGSSQSPVGINAVPYCSIQNAPYDFEVRTREQACLGTHGSDAIHAYHALCFFVTYIGRNMLYGELELLQQ